MPGPGPLDQMTPDSSARWPTCGLAPISQPRTTHAIPAHTGTQGHACRRNVSFVIGGWWMVCIKDINRKARTLLTGRTEWGGGAEGRQPRPSSPRGLHMESNDQSRG